MRKYLLGLFMFVSSVSTAQVFFIQGNVFYDVNYNGLFENGLDSALVNQTIRVTQVGAPVVYNIQTDQYGYYSVMVDPGEYTVEFMGSYNATLYFPVQPADVLYSGNDYEYVDLVFTPKAPPPTYVGAKIYNISGSPLPPSGSTQQYTLQYGFTNPDVASMPAKITLDFNPKLSLTGYTLAPSKSTPGHVEWNLSNVQESPDYPFANTGDTIHCTFSIPALGDTISAIQIQPAFIPGVALDTVDNVTYVQGVYDFLNHPEPVAKGVTNGIKWLYAVEGGGNSINCVDTAFIDDGYFIAKTKDAYDSLSGSNKSALFISKLNKDGLPFWEKEISYTVLQKNFDLINLQSVSDGGFVVFGNFRDTAYNYNIGAVKFDASGNMIWMKSFTNSNNTDEYVQDAIITPDNGFLLTGFVDEINSIPNAPTKENLVMMKLSATGELGWRKEYGGANDDVGIKLLALKNGNYLVLGATNSNDGDVHGAHAHGILFVENRDTIYNLEAWVLNVNTNGNIIWDKCYGGSGYGYFTGAAESAGGILLSGFTNSKNGDLPYYSELAVPLWLLQINNTGSITWSKPYKFYAGYKDTSYVVSPINADAGPFFNNLSATKDGNFLTAGSIQDDYGTIRSRHGENDFCFVKINPAGNLLWQKAIGGTRYEYMYGYVTDKNDDIIFTGISGSNNDDLYGAGKKDQGTNVIGKIGITNVIKGQVFVDNNSNGIKDANEFFYNSGRIQSAKIKDTVTGYIFNGQFLNNVDTGNYVTAYLPANNYYTVSPASQNTSFTTLDQTASVNFALKPKQNINDLEVQLIPLSPARPGFETSYRIITKNVGTTTISNAVTSLKKDSRQTLIVSTQPVSGAIADSVWWGPITLDAFAADTIDLVLQNDPPPSINSGDTLTVIATANPVANDSSALNNRMVLVQNVRGSFDPNDKTEIHGGQLTPVAYSNNEYLQYLVRFQNTGSDTAFFVTVKDTLDAKLDLSTVDVQAASHQYNFKIDNNVVTWDFKFIKLVDSATDEFASRGYILFRVKPKRGLSVGDAFSNSAAIYFDYNLPVITNIEKTYIKDGSTICPGGSIKYTSSIAGSAYQWQVNTGSGYTNIANSAIYSGATTSSLQITAAPSSLYGYKYRCLVNGNTYSAESQLKFVITWTGAADTNWQNAANWSCGAIPDANTDVIIKTTAKYPEISANVSCRSINATAGATLLVKAGVIVTVTGK